MLETITNYILIIQIVFIGVSLPTYLIYIIYCDMNNKIKKGK